MIISSITLIAQQISGLKDIDPKQSCTIVFASDNKEVFAASNEDFYNIFGTIWFIPADNGKYGRIYFGWNNIHEGLTFPQGGMNEKGLFFDAAVARPVVVPHDSTKPQYDGNIALKAMEECSTVEEVIALFNRYDQGGTVGGQYLFGDRFGNSVIIEPNNFLRKTGRYQLVTNFYHSSVKPGNITDIRYRLASELFSKSDNISVELFRNILYATHYEDYSGSLVTTLYSYICDLKKGDIYLYHFHNFEEVVKINIHEELKKGERSQSIISLFSQECFAAKRFISQRILGMLNEITEEKGINEAIAFLRDIKRLEYKDYLLTVELAHLIAFGNENLLKGNTDEAIEIYKYAVSEYPQSINAYEKLGEAYIKSGNIGLGIQNYNKAIELTPDSLSSKDILDRLNKGITDKAREIHERALVIDSHVDIAGTQYATPGQLDPGTDNPILRCDLVKMERGSIDAVFLAVTTSEGKLDKQDYENAYKEAMGKIQAIRRLTELYPDKCALALSSNDVENINQSNRKAIMIGLEGGYMIGDDLFNIDKLYKLGTRYISLIHNGYNQICDSYDPLDTPGYDKATHKGLSEFGKRVVAKMNQVGIICDVTHMSKESFYDLIEFSRAPVIASHSNCSSLCNHIHNLDDEQIRTLAKKGGVVQITAVGNLLKPIFPEYYKEEWKIAKEIGLPLGELWTMSEKEREVYLPKIEEFKKRWAEYAKKCDAATVKDLVDHIDHIVKIAGIDHVGIGSDFDGGGGIPGFENHSEALSITIELVRRGYSESDIRKIWGGNLLRVWKEVERVASQ